MALNTSVLVEESDKAADAEVRRWLDEGTPTASEARLAYDALSARIVNAHSRVALYAALAAVLITWAGICFALAFSFGGKEPSAPFVVIGSVVAVAGGAAVVVGVIAFAGADKWTRTLAAIQSARLAEELAAEKRWLRRFL